MKRIDYNDNPAGMADGTQIDRQSVKSALDRACQQIAPVWPLGNFVAVNPYLGFAEHSFEEVADRMAKTAGARTAMPADYYLAAIDDGRLQRQDIAAALAVRGGAVQDGDAQRLVDRVRERGASTWDGPQVPTVADAAGTLTGHDWNALVVERVSSWAGHYFDEGQVMWPSVDRDAGVYGSWREEAKLDRTPEVMGLPGFRRIIADLPENSMDLAVWAMRRLLVPEAARDLYLHRVLMRVGGWAAYAGRVVWDANLQERSDDTLLEFLAIQLAWEVAIFESLSAKGVGLHWNACLERLDGLVRQPVLSEAARDELILQQAFDLSEQRRIVEAFANRPTADKKDTGRPDAQAIFCIDVRSEVYRRQLETTSPAIETIGFAGFFAFAIDYVGVGHERQDTQCPVLLTPTHTVHEDLPDPEGRAHVLSARRLKHHVRRAWYSFKMGAISCFSFVGPVGLLYLPKLFTDSFGLTRPVPHPEQDALDAQKLVGRRPALDGCGDHHHHHGGHATGIPLDERIALAEGALRAMSLTENFAPLVLITGHGSSTVNNPHWTGLDCGACGGHTGEANARVAAAVFNDPAVRQGLAERGIRIPDDTVFLACQHDTTTDEVTVFNRDEVPASHAGRLADIEQRLAEAGRLTRAERTKRLPMSGRGSVDEAIVWRSRDWAQLRPEWGLASCSAFIVAPRERTGGLDLKGRSFLHSYDWRQDDGFGVLELIMTAPMVVGSWISLQYYASTVDNRVFGAGNKTLHNVVGRVGVYEGNGGDLRVGLPWQSIHDGEGYQHEPLRLNVVIEAPIDAMNGVLEKHAGVRALCDNGWVQLLAMDDHGRVSHRYVGDLKWARLDSDPGDVAKAA
jgi:uncharacterized protein YbcC (UPF0753/DUF2309 family)